MFTQLLPASRRRAIWLVVLLAGCCFPAGAAVLDDLGATALSAELGETLPYDSLAQLRTKLVEEVPHLKAVDTVPENDLVPVEASGNVGEIGGAATDHFLTNPILRASPLMGELQAAARERKAGKLAAE